MKLSTILFILLALYLAYYARAAYVPESMPFASIPEHYGCGCGGS